MLKLLKKETLTPQTERIYKVPLCIQDTIPIYRIAENGIFELEKPTSGSKKGIHQFDRMYLFEDINFSTQDEEEKEDTCSKFETLLRSMNVSYKIIVSNHYADNNKLREEILQKAVSKEMEPLAKEYHKMIGERLEEGRGGLLQSKYFVVSCRMSIRRPRTQSSIAIAIHMPRSPIRGTSTSASPSRTIQMLHRFIMLGTNVSPVPRSAPAATMETP